MDEGLRGDRAGIGLGLRWELLDEVLESEPEQLAPVRFFEISPENYARRGGYVPYALARVAERFPLTTHGLSLSLGGTDPLDGAYLEEVSSFLRRFGGPWHSDHLSFSRIDGVMLHELLPFRFDGDAVQRVAERIQQAATRLDRPMVVENISYYAEWVEGELTEPEFISGVLETADCGLLLDLNNLDVNAANHGFDPWTWLSRIPLDRVVEVHVAGPEPGPEGLLIDTHGSAVRSSVYRLLEWVIERTGPVPVLLEWDNHVPPLRDLIAEAEQLEVVYARALSRRCVARGVPGAA